MTSAKLGCPGDSASTPRRGPSRGQAAEGAEARAAPRARTAPLRPADLCAGSRPGPARPVPAEREREPGGGEHPLSLDSPRLCVDLGKDGAGGNQTGEQF